MSTPSPADLLHLLDTLVERAGRVHQAFKAAHDDLYALTGSAGAEGMTRKAGDHSDPVGSRWDADERLGAERRLRNAYNAISSARMSIDQALYGHLRPYRHSNTSAEHSDNDPEAIMNHEYTEAKLYQAKRKAMGHG